MQHKNNDIYLTYVFGKGTFVNQVVAYSYIFYIFGTFMNQGDGGFRNICCSGNFTQSGGRYMFQEI